MKTFKDAELTSEFYYELFSDMHIRDCVNFHINHQPNGDLLFMIYVYAPCKTLQN